MGGCCVKSDYIATRALTHRAESGNTPGTRGWSRLCDRMLGVKSRKNARNSVFFISMNEGKKKVGKGERRKEGEKERKK